MEKSANLGYAEAQYYMGMAFYHTYTLGFNNPNADEECELFWYKSACNNGVDGACNAMGIIYEKRGLINDAFKAYEKAILLDQENEDAIANLSALIDDAVKIYRKEMGVEDDYAPENRVAFIDDALEAYNRRMTAGNSNPAEILSTLNIQINDPAEKGRAIATPKGFAEYWNKNNPDNKMPIPKI